MLFSPNNPIDTGSPINILLDTVHMAMKLPLLDLSIFNILLKKIPNPKEINIVVKGIKSNLPDDNIMALGKELKKLFIVTAGIEMFTTNLVIKDLCSFVYQPFQEIKNPTNINNKITNTVSIALNITQTPPTSIMIHFYYPRIP